MGLSEGTRGWLKSATPDQLRAKLAEYETLDERRHSGRDAEVLMQLRVAIRQELEVRG